MSAVNRGCLAVGKCVFRVLLGLWNQQDKQPFLLMDCVILLALVPVPVTQLCQCGFTRCKLLYDLILVLNITGKGSAPFLLLLLPSYVYHNLKHNFL